MKNIISHKVQYIPTFLKEGALKSRNLFSKSWLEGPKPQEKAHFQTLSNILGASVGILDKQVLQVVGEWPWRC